jgi:GTP-binding protein LepA
MIKKIRNFAIVAHIDHGKSTLADRFLELTGTIEAEKMRPQFLDTMDLEREKGITIKLQTARMEYQGYILNMIDTPGHVDFTYEVSRSLAAIEGVVLLVDALKGIQAQTLMNLDLARKQNLVIIPVINKIDLAGKDSERIEEVSEEIANLLEIDKKEIIKISAKQGTDIEKVLQAVINRIPPPSMASDSLLRALIFDFEYDSFQGVIAHIRVMEGSITKGDEIYLINAQIKAKAKEVGYFKPGRLSQQELKSGEIGYVVLGIKESEKAKIGDTIINMEEQGKIKPLMGYMEPKPVVFVGLFPEDPNNWSLLREALLKLKLNDPSLNFKPESKSAFGRGFHCGFLGLLHIEIVVERLRREFNLELMTSSPSVCYKVLDFSKKERLICSVMDWPDQSTINKVYEQFCELKIIVPIKFLGKAVELVEHRHPGITHLSTDKVLITCEMPFREIMANLYDKIKSTTQGFGSMDYKFLDWREADLIKLEILVLGNPENSFSRIIPASDAYQEGKAMVEKLKNVFPSQLFSVPLQARVGGNIIARQTVSARRKDVIAPLYGGDYTRKRKLLEKQKKGKKKLKLRGQLKIPQEVFWKMMR